MQILIIRHTNAEKREDWNELGNPDKLRPLTKRGLSRFSEAVSGLTTLIPQIDHIYTSQFTRALQTAEILHGQYRHAELTSLHDLNPDSDISKCRSRLAKHQENETIALIGHQPELTQLTCHLLGTSEDLFIRFKKGGIALLSYMDEKAQLQWLLTQQQISKFSLI